MDKDYIVSEIKKTLAGQMTDRVLVYCRPEDILVMADVRDIICAETGVICILLERDTIPEGTFFVTTFPLTIKT